MHHCNCFVGTFKLCGCDANRVIAGGGSSCTQQKDFVYPIGTPT